jgi:hypothetical protein
MKKPESKQALHELFSQWKRELSPAQVEHPSFYEFKEWVQKKGYSHYLKFRSVAGADYDAELWFDQFFKQMWRR